MSTGEDPKLIKQTDNSNSPEGKFGISVVRADICD